MYLVKVHKLRGTQRSPKLALRNTDSHAPENLIFPTLVAKFPGSEMSPGLFQDFMDEYVKP